MTKAVVEVRAPEMTKAVVTVKHAGQGDKPSLYDAASSSGVSSDYDRLERPFVGTCLTMCPEEERQERERHRLLHSFEVLRGTESSRFPRADPNRMVKDFRRSAAGRALRVADLRPGHVLTQTVKYLLGDLMRQLAARPGGVYTIDTYEFVFDRLRAVRQDLVVQRVSGEAAVFVYEQTLAFLVLFGYHLCDNPSFVVKFNETHLGECFGQLMCVYEDLSASQRSSARSSSNRRVLRNLTLYKALQTLHNLDKPDCLHLLLNRVPPRNLNFPPISTAVAITRAYQSGNYYKFFKILTQDVQHPLMLAFLMKHCVYVQIRAINVMYSAYSSKNLSYPLDHLCQILMFRSEDEASRLLTTFGIKTVDNRVVFGVGSQLPVRDSEVAKTPKWKRFRFIDEILQRCPHFPLKN